MTIKQLFMGALVGSSAIALSMHRLSRPALALTTLEAPVPAPVSKTVSESRRIKHHRVASVPSRIPKLATLRLYSRQAD